jgi:tyrosinase
MRAELTIADAAGAYLTWAPVRATVRLLEPEGPDPVDVVLANGDPAHGGQLEFGTLPGGAFAPTLALTLPPDGTPVELLVAGDFPKASSEDGDAVVKASHVDTGEALATMAVMVRIRKDANALGAAERDRFVVALAKLNDQGAGLFRDFRAMHKEPAALNQAHGRPGFLSWHRAYLLDLERELQKIDPSVTLPYWRFDHAAPGVFSPDFMGRTANAALGNVSFSPTNLLRFWQTDEGAGISRAAEFDTRTEPANVSKDAGTLALGGVRPNAVFDRGVGQPGFDRMEGNPHGNAHTSFSGLLHDPATAPRDPLFFLLHCNVDRLWAQWQWLNDRFDGTHADTYFFRDPAGSPGAEEIGHNLPDTMWPWNNVTGAPRPDNAPRTPFPAVATAPAPGSAPRVGDMIDYAGVLAARSYTGFAYDDVPFGVAP